VDGWPNVTHQFACCHMGSRHPELLSQTRGSLGLFITSPLAIRLATINCGSPAAAIYQRRHCFRSAMQFNCVPAVAEKTRPQGLISGVLSRSGPVFHQRTLGAPSGVLLPAP